MNTKQPSRKIKAPRAAGRRRRKLAVAEPGAAPAPPTPSEREGNSPGLTPPAPAPRRRRVNWTKRVLGAIAALTALSGLAHEVWKWLGHP